VNVVDYGQQQLFIGHSKGLTVWDCRTNQINQLGDHLLPSQLAPVVDIKCHKSRPFVLVCGGREAQVFDTRVNKCMYEVKTKGYISAGKWKPDLENVFVLGLKNVNTSQKCGGVAWFSMSQNSPVWASRTESSVSDVTFGTFHDKDYFLAATETGLQLWDSFFKQTCNDEKHSDAFRLFSCDSKLFAFTTNEAVRIYQVSQAKKKLRHVPFEKYICLR